ncbi:MAG: four helix bundle protein [Spirosomataceae bacterium]
MRDFRKYEVWQPAHSLVPEVYSISKNFPQNELYGLTGQLRRAAASIPTNISEGCGRNTDAEFARFLHISLGSAHEVEYLLQLAHDLAYIEKTDYQSLHLKINEVKRKVYHLEQKINNAKA